MFTTPARSDRTAASAAKINAGAYSSVEKRSASRSSDTRRLGRRGRPAPASEQRGPEQARRDDQQRQPLDELREALVHAQQLHARPPRPQHAEEERAQGDAQGVALPDE